MNWFKKKSDIVIHEDVQNYINMYCNMYKTQCVCSSIKQVLKGEKYCIEVWVNLNAACHVIVAYATSKEETEDENISEV